MFRSMMVCGMLHPLNDFSRKKHTKHFKFTAIPSVPFKLYQIGEGEDSDGQKGFEMFKMFTPRSGLNIIGMKSQKENDVLTKIRFSKAQSEGSMPLFQTNFSMLHTYFNTSQHPI